MNVQVLVAIVGVAAALTGSVIGGLTSYFSTRSMKRLEWKLTLREKEISRRENLYSEFIAEANRLVICSFWQKIANGSELTPFLAIESRIWFHSTEIGALAREIATCVVDHHHKGRKDGAPAFANLRDGFIAACRKDLAAIRDGA